MLLAERKAGGVGITKVLQETVLGVDLAGERDSLAGFSAAKDKSLNRIYETVGCVKGFLHTPLRALGKRAPFRSLGKGFAIVNPQARC